MQQAVSLLQNSVYSKESIMLRTATEDVNDGRTELQARKREEKRVSTSFVPQIEGSIQGSAAALTGLLTVGEDITSAVSANINEAKSSAAATRQGEADAVNAIDASNKRTGISKFLFGEDAGYSTAVAIATKNYAEKAYVSQAGQGAEYAHLTAKDYDAQVLRPIQEGMAERFGDDPAAMKIAQDAWAKGKRSLVREQQVAANMYSKQQAYATAVESEVTRLDIATLNSSEAITPQGRAEADLIIDEVLFSSTPYLSPDGVTATPTASRNIKLKAAETAMRAGNSNVMRALQEGGMEEFTQGMTDQQKTRANTMMQEYDNTIARESQSVAEVGMEAILNDNPANVQVALDDLDDMRSKLSGSDKSKIAWQQDRNRLLRANAAYNTQKNKEQQTAWNGVRGVQALWTGDEELAAVYLSDTKSRKAGAEYIIMNAATAGKTVDTEMSLAEGMAAVFEDRAKLTSVVTQLDKSGLVSKEFGVAINLKMSSLLQQDDGSGFLTPESRQQIRDLGAVWDTSPMFMAKAVGQDADAVMQITRRHSEQSIKSIEAKISAFQANKGTAKVTTAQLNIEPGQTKYDYIQGAFPTTNLDNASLAFYSQQFDIGYQIYQSAEGAREYMTATAELRDRNWAGTNIKNGGLLEQYGGEGSLSSAFANLDGTPTMTDMIAERVGNQVPGTEITSLKELPDVAIEVDPGTGMIYVNSSAFPFPIARSYQELMLMGKSGQEQKQFAIAAEKTKLAGRAVPFDPTNYGRKTHFIYNR